MNIHSHQPSKRSASGAGSGSLEGGPPPPYDKSMEKRVLTLEEFKIDADKRFDRIELRLDQTATKADLADLRTEMHKGFADMIKWMVGLTVVTAATGITIMTFVLNNAVPRGPAASPALQPIIIQLPQPATMAAAPQAPAPPSR